MFDDKAFFPPKPYDPNSGSPKGTLTIGYGTTNPEIIKKYLNKMTKEEANSYLLKTFRWCKKLLKSGKVKTLKIENLLRVCTLL